MRTFSTVQKSNKKGEVHGLAGSGSTSGNGHFWIALTGNGYQQAVRVRIGTKVSPLTAFSARSGGVGNSARISGVLSQVDTETVIWCTRFPQRHPQLAPPGGKPWRPRSSLGAPSGTPRRGECRKVRRQAYRPLSGYLVRGGPLERWEVFEGREGCPVGARVAGSGAGRPTRNTTHS